MEANPPAGHVHVSVTISGPAEVVCAFLERGGDPAVIDRASVSVAIAPDRRRRPRWREFWTLPSLATRDTQPLEAAARDKAQLIGLEHVEAVLEKVRRLGALMPRGPRG